ncbi:MAG: tRNA adenosine(34) deaminase TadA [Pseudomonadota bacterium]
MCSGNKEVFMKAALQEAKKALALGEVPVGAVLVKGDEIIARGHNSSIALHDASAHAEMIALRQAGQSLRNYRLADTDLYVTLEPCIMCMGALVHGRVKRIFFGARDPKAGAAGSVFDFSCEERLNHSIEVSAGLLEEQCRSLLQNFFRSKR